MLHIFKFTPFLIDIDSGALLNIDHFADFQIINESKFMDSLVSSSIAVPTIYSILESLWEKIHDGLTLNDIENALFFILFLRFVILSLRYNLKTSFYITCIGLFAGYLWYRHLIDLISMYRSVLLQLPFIHKLGMDAVQLRSLNQETLVTDLNINWYNPGQILYYAFKNGIISIDSETGFQHYIDPISMFVSKFQAPIRSNVSLLYYKVYNNIIPKIFDICSKFWAQLSGIAAYAVITRIGKRYCPYLIRWHWTFLLIIGIVEQIFVYFIYRAYYFQTFILIPQSKIYESNTELSLEFQLTILNLIITSVVLSHIGFIIFGLFHAIWGQYFYVPFLVKNTELHIGKRPIDSIYSGGQTAWQETEEKKQDTLFPKLWYGWFGRGTQRSINVNNDLKKFFTKILKKLKKQFRL